MKNIYKNFVFSLTTTDTFSNINSQILKFLKKSEVRNGLVIVYTEHTTTGIRILEEERLLIEDIKHFMERIASSEVQYKHDNIQSRDVPDHERINAYSHLRSFYSNTSEIIPVVDGKLQLGKWQSVMLIDFDKRRKRKICVTIVGEK